MCDEKSEEVPDISVQIPAERKEVAKGEWLLQATQPPDRKLCGVRAGE